MHAPYFLKPENVCFILLVTTRFQHFVAKTVLHISKAIHLP